MSHDKLSDLECTPTTNFETGLDTSDTAGIGKVAVETLRRFVTIPKKLGGRVVNIIDQLNAGMGNSRF